MPKNYDFKAVVAANVQTLLDHASDTGKDWDSPKRLAKKAGLGHMTIYRMLRGQAAKIDELESVARVFKLHAWQLLIPELDPTNPPVVPLTTAERRFYAEVKRAARVFRNGEDLSEGEDGAASGVHRDREGAGSGPGSRERGGEARSPRGKKTRPA